MLEFIGMLLAEMFGPLGAERIRERFGRTGCLAVTALFAALLGLGLWLA